MENKELVVQINKELAIDLPEKISSQEMRKQLIIYVNNLIKNDFQKLVSLLYRIDVSEPKITLSLQQQPGEDAAKIIAALIIERQLEKIKTRQQYRRQNDNFTGEEKW